jgi:hypothetical protein
MRPNSVGQLALTATLVEVARARDVGSGPAASNSRDNVRVAKTIKVPLGRRPDLADMILGGHDLSTAKSMRSVKTACAAVTYVSPWRDNKLIADVRCTMHQAAMRASAALQSDACQRGSCRNELTLGSRPAV